MDKKTTDKPLEFSSRQHGGTEGKWYKDPLGGIIFGAIVILVGVLLFVDRQFYLEDSWLWWFIAGVGVILLIEAIIRYAIPEYRRPVGGKLVAAVILLAWAQVISMDWRTGGRCLLSLPV